MLFSLLVLFLAAFISGCAVFFLTDLNMHRFKVMLSFSGAYLFSITVIHLLPELFHEAEDLRMVGIYVLAGFFLQMVLEYFTSGVEHGHIHTHEGRTHVPYALLISLSIHAFLEGTLLVHPTHDHGTDDVQTLLYGLILHKIPEAFALMSVLMFSMRRKYVALLLLFIFSLTSPLGLFLSNLFYHNGFIPEEIFIFLFALVAGNFLYISTTIFFETSPTHKFKANKLIVSLLGALLAILAEYFL